MLKEDCKEPSYPERTGGLSASVSIALISLESTMYVWGSQMPEAARERITEIMNGLSEAKEQYGN